jgi:hypothetical protein
MANNPRTTAVEIEYLRRTGMGPGWNQSLDESENLRRSLHYDSKTAQMLAMEIVKLDDENRRLRQVVAEKLGAWGAEFLSWLDSLDERCRDEDLDPPIAQAIAYLDTDQS